MILSEISLHECFHIVELTGDEKTQHRLLTMGFVPGAKGKIINHPKGSAIVKINEARLGLSNKLLGQIIVEPCQEENCSRHKEEAQSQILTFN